MQHVGVGEHHVGVAADLRARLARGVAVVDRRAHPLGQPERVAARAPGPGPAPWSGTGTAPARAASRQSTSRVGRLKHSDLPEAVPVVTIVGPSQAACSASRLMGVQPLDPQPAASAAEHVRVQLRAGARRAAPGPGPSCASRTSRPSSRPCVQQRAPRLGSCGLGPRSCDSRGDARPPSPRDNGQRPSFARRRPPFHHSSYSAGAHRGRARRAALGLGVPARAGVRRHGRADRRAAASSCARRARSTRSWSSTPPPRTAPPTVGRARRARVVRQEAELMPPTARCSARATRCGARCRCSRASSSASWTPTPRTSPSHFATGLLGPLVLRAGGRRSSRPSTGARWAPARAAPIGDGGGRVNHLMARPALELFYPQLAGVRQPLAGEVAARRELLERLPFATGYGVEIAMLIDVWREVGPRADRPGGPRGAPQPPPAAVGARADGADGAGHDRPPPARGRPAAGARPCGAPLERPPAGERRRSRA